MFCKPVSTLAVAALLLAGAANAWEPWGGARSVSILRIGAISSTQEDNPVGDYDAAAVAKRPGFQGNEAAVQTFADPGYEATADVAGESFAEAESEDAIAFGLWFAEGNAFTGSDGSTEANTLLEAGSIAAQVDEGTAAGGSFGGVFAAATPTTDEPEDFDGATAESVLPVVAISEATPGSSRTYLFTDIFGEDEVPFTRTRADADNAETTAELSLTQLACAGLRRGECR